MGIVRREVKNELLRRRVIFTFHQVLDHCEQELAATRNPFPIPSSVEKLDESPGSRFAEAQRRSREAKEWVNQSRVPVPGKAGPADFA